MSPLLGAFIAAIATTVGAIPILFIKYLKHRTRDMLLAITAGVMMAATAFNLIPGALEQGHVYEVTAGILFGAIVLMYLTNLFSQEEIESREDYKEVYIDPKSAIVLIALALHNVPEGFSVGVGYGQSQATLGPIMAIAIGLQNIPEGLLLALYLRKSLLGNFPIIGIVTVIGLAEYVSAVAGFFLVKSAAFILPFSLGTAAGAMIYIIYRELIPESHGDGNEKSATLSFIFGIICMILINELFI